MSKLEDFKYSRWVNSAQSTFQFILVCSLFVGLNTLSITHFNRYDITENRKYGLSPETISYIHELNEPIRIIVTKSTDDKDSDLSDYYTDIENLVREYEYESRKNGNSHIQSEVINVFQQSRLAQGLVEEFGINKPNLVIFASENKHRVITPDEVYRMEDQKKSAFRGEQIFTSALLDVSGSDGNTIYFMKGHGELDINSVDPVKGLSLLSEELKQRNFKVDSLDLTQLTARIPDDADLLVLAGPQQPLLAREVNILKDYLGEKAGRLIVLIDPATNNNLGDLFYQWGILADDMIVLDDGPDGMMTGGDLLLRRFDSKHPITESLAKNSQSVVVGLTRPIRADIGAPIDDRLTVIPIVGGSDNSWGERFYRPQGQQIGFDESVDLKGPVSVAVVSERSISSDLGIDIPGGRMVVFGTSNLITNNRLNVLGNFTLILNTLNWALDRNNLLSIAPKPIDRLHITLSQEEMKKLRLALWFLLPGCSAIFGTFVYWLRRS
jgi:ABC-type uncharacterized transport system involved in gliding motility auxiliary subunit